MIETWLALATFTALALLWVVLPSRLMRRGNGSALATVMTAPASPSVHAHASASRFSPSPPPNGTILEPDGFGRLRRYPGNTGGSASIPRFMYVANLSGLNGFEEVTVPIFREAAAGPDIRRRETYRAEVAGTVLEAGNLPALRHLLSGAVLRLMQTRLPHLWFGLSGGSVPVERRNGGYEARVREGPVITAPTLALLRERLARYALSAGLVEREEDLTLSSLGPDLRPHAPLAVLVGPRHWVPLFVRDDLLRPEGVALPAGRGPFPAPAGLLPLARELAHMLIGPSGSWTQVVLADIAPAVWEAIVPALRPVPRRLRARGPDGTPTVVPLFAWEDILLCAPGGERHTVYFASSDWELADRLGRAFVRAGQIAHRDDLRVERSEDREEVTRR